MSSVIADNVLAATHKLVQQAMTGRWQDVPKTVHERRVLLDQLSASATPQDRQWLSALQQAMAESDAAVAKMAAAGAGPVTDDAMSPAAVDDPRGAAAAVDSMMEMLKQGR
jgi:hypothetical protein